MLDHMERRSRLIALAYQVLNAISPSLEDLTDAQLLAIMAAEFAKQATVAEADEETQRLLRS